jgi:hypothetical protein
MLEKPWVTYLLGFAVVAANCWTGQVHLRSC